MVELNINKAIKVSHFVVLIIMRKYRKSVKRENVHLQTNQFLCKENHITGKEIGEKLGLKNRKQNYQIYRLDKKSL